MAGGKKRVLEASFVWQVPAGLDCFAGVVGRGKITRARSGMVIEKQSFLSGSRSVGNPHTRSIQNLVTIMWFLFLCQRGMSPKSIGMITHAGNHRRLLLASWIRIIDPICVGAAYGRCDQIRDLLAGHAVEDM